MNDEPLHPTPLENLPKRKFISTVPASLLTTMATVLLATGSATAWWTWQTFNTHKLSVDRPAPETVLPTPQDAAVPPTTNHAPPTVEPSPPPTAAAETEMRSLSIYGVTDTGTDLELAPITISLAADQTPEAMLETAFDRLLDGVNTSAVASTIPTETQLNSLDVRSDGIHVDLSERFTQGGGSASMMGRLGQVVYTATTLDPEADVWISVEGEPLEVLGGEGLMVSQPLNRAAFDKDFSL